MFNTIRHHHTLLALSLAGALFAGYLSAVKLFTGGCSLTASCSYLLGYPTCYYGFGMFAVLLLLSIGYIVTGNRVHTRLMAMVALAGVLFSSFFTIKEISEIFTDAVRHTLILPSCAYGLVVYIIILVIAYKNRR